MTVYDITVEPDPSVSIDYRIKANSLEEAKQIALELCSTRDAAMLEFEADGQESDDQESEVDNSTRESQ